MDSLYNAFSNNILNEWMFPLAHDVTKSIYNKEKHSQSTQELLE